MSFRRRVFYIPGYDPFPPRRYRELYRKEGAAQARISGYRLSLSANGPFGWTVQSEIAGEETQAEVEVLVWADLVRHSMGHSIPATYWQMLRTAWAYIGSGALWRLMQLRKGPTIAALYPVVFLLGQLALALGLGWLGASLVTRFAPPLLHPLAALLGLGLTWGVLEWFRRHDGKVFAYYLMQDYAYSARYNGANPPELEARMLDFGKRIRAAFAEGYDEILVVGHSSGAHLAVSILADLLRDGLNVQNAIGQTKLAFLSLGHVVPMVSFLPQAKRLRGDLAYLSQSEALTWVDVTAPGDGCAFALCDPVAVSGVAPQGKRWPLVLSCAFTQSLSPERWAALRWRFFRLHFQYLCAFDRPQDYDYFQITAGPVPLATRYANRPPSKSRIERALNRYTSVA